MNQRLVLLVDDELPIIWICARVLLNAGFIVTTANTVAEALDRIQGQRCDLLICDLRLPDGNGLDVIREFLRLQAGRPAIVMSGSPEEGNEEQAESLGVRSYIQKPFEIDYFISIVREATQCGSAPRGRSGRQNE